MTFYLMVIKRVDKQLDEGNFTCKAQNFLGEDSSSAVVVVNGNFPHCANERTKIHYFYHRLPSRKISFPRPFFLYRSLRTSLVMHDILYLLLLAFHFTSVCIFS